MTRQGAETKRRPPDYRVYTRVGPSKIHGVGVFAIRPIKKGTPIFYGDNDDLVWVKKAQMRRIAKPLRQLYEDFCIQRGGKYGCPRNFNLMTTAWYLNHSPRPNVRCDSEYRFFALRNIEIGEELTADYRTFSEGVPA